MKKTLIFILLIIAGSVGVLSARTAAEMLKDASAQLTSSPSVVVNFTMTTDSGPLHGTLTMSRNRYVLKSGGFAVWFDGTTQWVYSSTTNEVSITTPDSEELMESNPFMLLTEYATRYSLTKKGENTVVLTPKTKQSDGVASGTVVLGKNDRPVKLTVNFSNGSRLVADITAIKAGTDLPATTFRYDTKTYPGAEIIDLR